MYLVIWCSVLSLWLVAVVVAAVLLLLCRVGWLVDSLIDWLIDGMIGLIDWVIEWLIKSLTSLGYFSTLLLLPHSMQRLIVMVVRLHWRCKHENQGRMSKQYSSLLQALAQKFLDRSGLFHLFVEMSFRFMNLEFCSLLFCMFLKFVFRVVNVCVAFDLNLVEPLLNLASCLVANLQLESLRVGQI